MDWRGTLIMHDGEVPSYEFSMYRYKPARTFPWMGWMLASSQPSPSYRPQRNDTSL